MSPFNLSLTIFLLFLSGCAVSRAIDAQTAQREMVGLSKENLFSCMGLPQRRGREGQTEVWLYKSGNDWSLKNKRSVSTTLADDLGLTFGMGDEVREKRFCTVQVVIRDGAVSAVNYNGPTGGFLTEDEQCAYAVRNCIKDKER